MNQMIEQKFIFNGASFKKGASFKNLTFEKGVDFSNARFEDNVYFNNSRFEEGADFHESEYGRIACFYGTSFEEIPNFSSSVFSSGSKLNLINSTLAKPQYSFEQLREQIEDKISKPKDFKDKKLNSRERQRLKREWLEEREKIADDYRDSFRTLKNALLKDNNLLDAQEHHRMELFCKEIGLMGADGKKMIPKEHPKSEKRGELFNFNKFKELVDQIHLAFYRNLCDHHTNLFKMVNNLVILVALFALFAWGLKELTLIGDPINKTADLLYETTKTSILHFLETIVTTAKTSILHFLETVVTTAKTSILHFLETNVFATFTIIIIVPIIMLFSVIVILAIVIFVIIVAFLKINDFATLENKFDTLKNLWQRIKFFLKDCFSLLLLGLKNFLVLIQYLFYCAVFLLFVYLFGTYILQLSMEKTYYVLSVSLLFLSLFIWLVSLGNFILRSLVVFFAYIGFCYVLVNLPHFINPLIGNLFEAEDKSLLVKNPFFITLTIVYSFLMFLLLFSLQKTARKNSIVPS